jgi:hypothetical protein
MMMCPGCVRRKIVLDVQSEVARIRQQVAAEYQAGRNGLRGLSQGSCTHQFINARMVRICELQEELEQFVGVRQAIQIVNDVAGGK